MQVNLYAKRIFQVALALFATEAENDSDQVLPLFRSNAVFVWHILQTGMEETSSDLLGLFQPDNSLNKTKRDHRERSTPPSLEQDRLASHTQQSREPPLRKALERCCFYSKRPPERHCLLLFYVQPVQSPAQALGRDPKLLALTSAF